MAKESDYFDDEGNKVSSETYVYIVRFRNEKKRLEADNKRAKEYLKLFVDYVEGNVFKFPMLVDIKCFLKKTLKLNDSN
jgi:hypothetical protein